MGHSPESDFSPFLALLVYKFVARVLLVDAAGDPWKHLRGLDALVVHETLNEER